MRVKPDETWDEYRARYREGWADQRHRLFMGTVALGGGKEKHDLSRDEEDYFVVDEELDNFYLGRWVTGLGFFNVAFPKATSRPVTDDEWEFFLNSPVAIV